MNCVNLVGRVTHDIELKATPSGTQYIQFDVAIDNGKDKEGNKRPATFIPCVLWGKQAETFSVYVHKGDRVGIEGRFNVDKYQNEKGENRYKYYTLVQRFEFLESKSKDNFVPEEPTNLNQSSYTTEQVDNMPFENDPFNYEEQMTIDTNSLPFD